MHPVSEKGEPLVDVAQATYPRQQLLVEPEWLAQHLDDPDLRVIDCDPPEVAMARPHIPGAVILPIHPYLKNTDTGQGVVTAPQIERIMSALGVGNETRVVCYDSQGGLLAARVWWALWYYGHEQGALLNGGWVAWQAADLPTESDWTKPQPATFSATAHEGRIAACDVILPGLSGGNLVPLDVRNDLEWRGTPLQRQNAKEGHIPGAVHIEWREFVNWQDNARFKPAGEIRALLESNGVTRDKRVVPY